MLEEILERLPEEFNMAELLGKAEERTPYQVVALQECERMNLLTQEIRCSLGELSLGLKVSLFNKYIIICNQFERTDVKLLSAVSNVGGRLGTLCWAE